MKEIVISPQNESINEERYVLVTPSRTNTVIHTNQLIEGLTSIEASQLKMLETLISSIDVNNPLINNMVAVKKEDIFKVFGYQGSNKYTKFSSVVRELQSAKLEFKKIDKKGKITTTSIVPVPKASWEEDSPYVLFRFDSDFMPFLVELKENFLQYQLKETIDLKNKNSIILFKMLIHHNNLYKRYRNPKNKAPVIKVNELRHLLGVTDKYEQYSDFQAKVLNPCIIEINKKTSINVTFEKMKVGRVIDSIKFNINEKDKTRKATEIEVVEMNVNSIKSGQNMTTVEVIEFEFRTVLSDVDRNTVEVLERMFGVDKIFMAVRHMIIQKKESFEIRLFEDILKNEYWNQY